MRVCVFGAGIAGTTTAFHLRKRFPGATIDIVAEHFSPNTVSDVAAGIVGQPGSSDDGGRRKWIASTFKLCFELWHRPDHLGDGLSELTKAVSLIPMIRYWDKTKAPPKGGHNDLWKTENVLYYREMTPGEVVRNRGTVVGENMIGETYSCFTLEPSIAIPILYKILQRLGVRFVARKVTDVDQLVDYEYVINCSGTGAKKLFGDENVLPVSGHVLRVKAPWIHTGINEVRTDGRSYIYPNRDSVILGSIDTPNSWSRVPHDPEDSQKILRGCLELVPSLKHAEVLKEVVGLRPTRRGGVRLEAERLPSGLTVIHNYGHGGEGVMMSWGCAEDVADLLQKEVEEGAARQRSKY